MKKSKEIEELAELLMQSENLEASKIIISQFIQSQTVELREKLKEAGWDDEMHKAGRNKWHKEYLKLRKEVDRLKESEDSQRILKEAAISELENARKEVERLEEGLRQIEFAESQAVRDHVKSLLTKPLKEER